MLGAAACAPARGAAYDAAFAAAARAESAGRFEEAARGYEQASGAARRPRDRQQAQWSAAETYARAQDYPEALARYDAIASDPAHEHQAEAALRAALVRIDHGQAERGWQELELVPHSFPAHGAAHVAVRRLVEHADEQGPLAGLAELRALAASVVSTEVEPLVLFLEAEHLEAIGEDPAAHAAYARIADRWPYPYGAFFDDSLWHLSLLDEKAGRYASAVGDLERLVRERETTILVGSYERPQYVPAMLRLGALYRDRLHDNARARAAFHRLYADFAHSTRRDDALWLEASLWFADGDPRTGCDRLALLVREFPASRYVPCAARQCPGVERRTSDVAPADCHRYIERAAGPGDAP